MPSFLALKGVNHRFNMKFAFISPKKISLAPAQPKTTQMFRNNFFGILSNMPHPRRQNGKNKMLHFVLRGLNRSQKRHRPEISEDVDLALGRCVHMTDLLGYLSKNGMFCQFDLSSFVSASIKCLLFLIFLRNLMAL